MANESNPLSPSHPWINSTGEVAHPSSPRGGGGPGRFAVPKSLGTSGNDSDSLPHSLSPSGRYLLSDGPYVLFADNSALAKKPVQSRKSHSVRPVTFIEFNNNGPAKYVEAIKSNQMGVHPKGNFPFVNAVELIFKVDLGLAKKIGIKEFRCRQKAQSQELWERELKDGNFTAWIKTMSDGEEPDDPADGLQTIQPPIIAYHDAPGFMATGKEPQLKGPQQKLTSKTAVSVFLRQNFIGWIEGSRDKKKTWEQVSDFVEWHSNQSLLRDILFTKSWVAADGCEIDLGHTQGAPK